MNVYQSSHCLLNNRNGSSDRKGTTCVNANNNSTDIVFSSGNNSNSRDNADAGVGVGDGYEDYQLNKKKKYIESRKVYLMKNTRDFFLRYKDKLEMKKKKK